MTTKTPKMEKGASLIEIISAIGVITAVAVGGTILFNVVSQNFKRQNMIQAIRGIVHLVNIRYSAQSNFRGAANLDAGVSPITMPAHVWGGRFALIVGAGDPNDYAILVSDVPEYGCVIAERITRGRISAEAGRTTIAFGSIRAGTVLNACSGDGNVLRIHVSK